MADDSKNTTTSTTTKKGQKEKPNTWEGHLEPHGEIKELFPGRLWEVEGTLQNGTLKRNMQIYKMEDGGLLLHSVVVLNDESMQKLESYGQPSILLIPNLSHTIDLKVYKQRYPNARVVAPVAFKTGLAEKKGITLDSTAEDMNAPGVRTLEVGGLKKSGGFGIGGERAYELQLDENSTALVFCDVLMNFAENTGIKKFLFGSTFEVSRAIRWGVVNKTSELKQWLLEQAEKPQLKIICISHGVPVLENAGPALKEVANKL